MRSLAGDGEAFLRYCSDTRGLSPHTLRAYTVDVHELCEYARSTHGVPEAVAEWGPAALRDYVRYLLTERRLGASTIRRRVACLKSMANWLASVCDTPSLLRGTRVELRKPKRLPRCLSETELGALISVSARAAGITTQTYVGTQIPERTGHRAFQTLTTLIAVELLFATGLRVSELTSVTIDRLNVKEGTIDVVGKGTRDRRVFIIDDGVRHLVKEYVRRSRARSSGHGHLLVTPRGAPATAQYVRRLLRIAGENAGIARRITPHMLRHSCATRHLEAGLDIRFVQQLLGHASITTTQIYTEVTSHSLREALSRAADSLRPKIE